MTSKEDDLLSALHIERDKQNSPSTLLVVLKWALIIALVVGVLGAVHFVLRPPLLEVEAVAAQPLPETAVNNAVLDASGYVTARRVATVSSKISGKIIEVRIEEGDAVNAGDILARLEDTDENAQMLLAQAQLAQVQAQLSEVESQLRQAQRDLNRQIDLSKKGLSSIQALETARTQVAVLDGSLQSRRAMINVAEAQKHIAGVNYDNTIIRAPFSGVVIAKAAQPGEILSPISAGGGFTRTGICTIVDMDSLEIEVDINEAYINRVKPRQPVEAVLDAYPQWKIPAEVIAIIPTADRSKATVKVRIALKQKDARIVPDMGIRVSFFETEPPSDPARPQGVLIPASAIAQREEGSVVFVIDGEQVRRRAVTAGQSYGDLRLVPAGLGTGERVVREPQANLQDGMRIKLK